MGNIKNSSISYLSISSAFWKVQDIETLLIKKGTILLFIILFIL